MNRKLIISLLLISLGALSACNSGYTRRNPGKNYAADMTYSRAYDAYTYNPNTKDSLTSQLPVPGTIARGHALPDNLTASDSLAYYAMTNPYTFNEKNLEEGKRLYLIQCGICHGTKLDGNGPLYNGGEGKYAAKPANLKDAAITAFSDGKLYYTIMYGKNMMGSYAHHLNHKQRWEVIAYMRSEMGGGAPAPTDANNATDTTTKKDEKVASK